MNRTAGMCAAQPDDHGGESGVRPVLLLVCLVAAGMALAGTGLVPSLAGVSTHALAAVAGALPLLLNALRELRARRLSADLAVLAAAAAAIAIGESFVAAEVILIMLVGGLLEEIAVGRTRGAIRALVRLAPREATRLGPRGRERVPIETIRPGDRIAVAPGERIPVDGRVLAGHSSIDRSALTGESIPADAGAGDPILAGSLNGAGALEIGTERVGPDTAFARMLHLIEEAEERRAPIQRLADRYAGFFLPAVLACAALTYVWTGGNVVRAVSVLVVACPCALVLATPTAIAAGIGRLARAGVLIKGGAALETLARCRSILLDKTGTLTLAQLRVSEIAPEPGTDDAALLRLAAGLEAASEHPLARAILAAARDRGIGIDELSDVAASPGLGIAGRNRAGAVVRAGSPAFLLREGIPIPESVVRRAELLRDAGRTLVLVALDDRCLGLVAARDRPRPEAAEAVVALRRLFGDAVCMLTGDGAGAAHALAAELKLDDIRADLLPEQKVEIARQFSREHGPVVMVGDGINDAGALAAADVGVALTDVGTDAAIDAADVAIFGERHLAKLPETILFARTVRRTIHQNIVACALGLNGLGIAAAGAGAIGPVAAAILHQISSLLVVANSLRLLWTPTKRS